MFKKKVGFFIAVSALVAGIGLGVGAIEAEASQWNNSSISQQQNSSGWSNIAEYQKSTIAKTQSAVQGKNGAAAGQTGFVSGSQVQNGSANGPATATQTQETKVKVGDVVNGNTQVTKGNGTTAQSTAVSGPTKLLQQQSNTNATYHFQGSIEGGPTLQQQINQNHNYQYSAAISK